MEVSKWIVIDDVCAMRIVKGGDPDWCDEQLIQLGYTL